jgi:hypothetical protein
MIIVYLPSVFFIGRYIHADMDQSKTAIFALNLLSALAITGCVIAVWYAFQRQMCAQTGGTCSPNIVYLGAALIAVIVSVVAFGARRRIPDK